MSTNITRRIHINPQSKGSLGKSFETEFRTAWLDYHQINWTGSDLDDRHHSFGDRHPARVQSYRLGNDDDSKSTLLGLFRSVSRADAPVHIIDCRAQADGLIVQALESLQIIPSLIAERIRFTFLLFPSEDTESMNNLLELFYFAGDRVDYVIVHNPAKVRTNLFSRSNIEAELRKFGAKELTLPVVTSITLLAIKRAETKAGRKLSFAEVASPGASHLEPMLAGEMQWAMQQMFRQYDAIADLLVPLTDGAGGSITTRTGGEGKPSQTPYVQPGRLIVMDKNDLEGLLIGAPAAEVDRIHRLLHECSVGPDSSFPVQLALLTRAQWRMAATKRQILTKLCGKRKGRQTITAPAKWPAMKAESDVIVRFTNQTVLFEPQTSRASEWLHRRCHFEW